MFLPGPSAVGDRPLCNLPLSFAMLSFNQFGLFLCEMNSQCFFDHAEDLLRPGPELRSTQ